MTALSPCARTDTRIEPRTVNCCPLDSRLKITFSHVAVV